jgi:hypothetical protein
MVAFEFLQHAAQGNPPQHYKYWVRIVKQRIGGERSLAFILILRHLMQIPCILARLRCASCDSDKGPRLPPLLAGGMDLMGLDGPNMA